MVPLFWYKRKHAAITGQASARVWLRNVHPPVMRLSMLCPTTPHPRTHEVIKGELTKKFRPIQGYLTLSRTIRICDKYSFRTTWLKLSERAMEILVRIGPHSRVVHLENQRELVPTIRRSFADVPRVANACKLFNISV